MTWIGVILAVVVVAALVVLASKPTANRQPTFLEKAIPYEEGKAPLRGWTLVEIEAEGRFWVDPKTLTASAPQHQLSPEQVGRIRAFKEILSDNDPTTLEQAVDNFSRDRDPDAEIAIWEHIAEVWSSEIKARGIEDPSHARLIYMAVVGCSLVDPTPEALLAWNPRMKEVSDLAGLSARYRGDSNHDAMRRDSD
jgi:hypothetical protein